MLAEYNEYCGNLPARKKKITKSLILRIFYVPYAGGLARNANICFGIQPGHRKSVQANLFVALTASQASNVSLEIRYNQLSARRVIFDHIKRLAGIFEPKHLCNRCRDFPSLCQIAQRIETLD